MHSYPACHITPPDGCCHILQLTDLHIAKATSAGDHKSCQSSFEAVLQAALDENMRCDLILVTGDLVSQVDSDIYDYIFARLAATGTPFACVAGNHDVTQEINTHLPFEQRHLLPAKMDSRLLERHCITTPHWQLLLINSATPGAVYGQIKRQDVAWLRAMMASSDKPTLVALHHHVIPMDSEWIDEHIARGADYFWQQLSDMDQLRVIISGHTHQDRVLQKNGVTAYSTPSTCYQFTPFDDDFSIDERAAAGYRWLQLGNNGQVASWVKRLDT